MGSPEYVALLSPSAAEDYPRLLYGHPRNRAVDWDRYWSYVQHGDCEEQAGVDLFVKVRRELDVILLGSWLFAASPRLRDVLEANAGGPIDFRPITVNGLEYAVPVVHRVIADSLHEDRGQLRRNDAGEITDLVEPVWRADRIRDPCLFRRPWPPAFIYATSGVEAAYHAAGCDNGLSFWRQGTVE